MNRVLRRVLLAALAVVAFGAAPAWAQKPGQADLDKATELQVTAQSLADLEQVASELGISGKVLFLGHRLDAPEIMSTFDIYCLPSFYEGMPLSIMEAWAAGKPVIATDVLGIAELVTHGVNGYLVPSDEPRKLADGIMDIVRNDRLREQLAENGNRFALEQCGIGAMVKRYEALYLKVMER